jgi:hypothetical protein
MTSSAAPPCARGRGYAAAGLRAIGRSWCPAAKVERAVRMRWVDLPGQSEREQGRWYEMLAGSSSGRWRCRPARGGCRDEEGSRCCTTMNAVSIQNVDDFRYGSLILTGSTKDALGMLVLRVAHNDHALPSEIGDRRTEMMASRGPAPCDRRGETGPPALRDFAHDHVGVYRRAGVPRPSPFIPSKGLIAAFDGIADARTDLARRPDFE